MIASLQLLAGTICADQQAYVAAATAVVVVGHEVGLAAVGQTAIAVREAGSTAQATGSVDTGGGPIGVGRAPEAAAPAVVDVGGDRRLAAVLLFVVVAVGEARATGPCTDPVRARPHSDVGR